MVKDCCNCEHHTWGDEWWNCKTECQKCKYTDMQGEKIPSNWKGKPKTNADRIRAMTDEELAEFLCGVYDNDEDYAKFINGYCIPYYNEDSIKEWLQQPAEGD